MTARSQDSPAPMIVPYSRDTESNLMSNDITGLGRAVTSIANSALAQHRDRPEGYEVDFDFDLLRSDLYGLAGRKELGYETEDVLLWLRQLSGMGNNLVESLLLRLDPLADARKQVSDAL